jgi:hypothetical protein
MFPNSTSVLGGGPGHQSAPEIPKPIGRQPGVAHRVLDILVPKVMLQGAGIVAVVGQFEAAGMAQHVRMDRKRQLGGLAEPCNQMMEAERAQRAATLRDEHVSPSRRVFTL